MQTPGRPVRIATDLVNTWRQGQERLRTATDLRQFLLDHAEPEPVRVTEEEVAEVRLIRRQLREVFEAEQERYAAAILNRLLAVHATRPYLSDHDGNPWHLHVTTMDASWAQWLAAVSATGLAVLVAGYGFGVLRCCAAASCGAAFVTTARRARRFCSPACATRTRVRAHRARARPGGRA